MKILLPLLIVPLLAACNAPPEQRNLPLPAAPEQEDVDVAIIHSLGDTAINNAIVTQHTLFPYHFVTGSPELNQLGRRELVVLCDHYRVYGGSLNVHQGDASDALYRQRIRRVTDMLTSSGVETEKVAISDGTPGGTGISSERVVNMLKSKDESKVDYQTPGKMTVPAVKGEQ